jgi:hypothetical protein
MDNDLENGRTKSDARSRNEKEGTAFMYLIWNKILERFSAASKKTTEPTT